MSEWRGKYKQKILSQLNEMLTQRLPQELLSPVLDFVNLYYRVSPLEELSERELDAMYGASLSCWEHLQNWDEKGPKIHVFNPDLERHGWHSSHTVIQILQKDMPFLVDSVRMELNRRGLSIHVVHSSVINVVRDRSITQGNDSRVVSAPQDDSEREALIYIEVDRHTNDDELKSIENGLADVLNDVSTVVQDFDAMTEEARLLQQVLTQTGADTANEEQAEISQFLDWMLDNRFTFLGFTQTDFEQGDINGTVHKSLGLSRKEGKSEYADALIARGERLSFGKDSRRSRVHRPAYRDLVVVRRFDEEGNLLSEYCFYGLYTSPVYTEPPRRIPVLRQRVQTVLDKAGFMTGGHNAKSLTQILGDLPRDELLLSSENELFDHAMGIFTLQERRKVRLLMRRDRSGQFYTALYYVPRDIFNTALRTQVQDLIIERLGATDCEFTTYYSESVLTRVYFVLALDPENSPQFDPKELEQDVALLSRSWQDELHLSLVETKGEERGNHLINLYRNALPSAYREHFTASSAVFDIENLEELAAGAPIRMSFYRQLEQARSQLRFKLFNADKPLILSDVIPILENLGMRVIGEHPYKVTRRDGRVFWLHDFTLIYKGQDMVQIEDVKQVFQDAFSSIWSGKAENDEFNRLVIGASLSWREVAMLRSYARYNQQIRFGFSQQYIAETLGRHLYIARLLVALFKARFEPSRQGRSKNAALVDRITNSINEALEKVDNLNDDKILRRYLELMHATLRTNYYQTDAAGEAKDYLVFKLNPHAIENIPLPRPMFEIFVYSARVEGVHLRGGKVARGGLRWSDRREDYRTEVLGLVKAQQVKNAVIVPVGAKGGFVAKNLPENGTREEVMEEGIACYKTFIRGLLDVTDNYVQGDVVSPSDVVCHDEQDPYLVVAADKGTATFSDIANSIAEEFGFWLGDAFASGGSQGYDHKKMGITARGAWESVKLHFRELGLDTQSENFTVVGIGDMAGDVFGNGMLMSEHIELVAAFNHMHIFIDPTPDAAASFRERQRLFDLPRSSWSDYDASLISAGGGIFSRNAKSIDISPEMKQRFGINADRLAPTDLISALLKSEVDLVWNGGIGTYVKASFESHSDVGDKANDALRINGNELRCKVLGEGGNLGFTQLGRIEFGLTGGACNTDFIDNAGGVDCSDHEVNIKILLNEVLTNGDLTVKQRNSLLRDMTDEVSTLVLNNNYNQALAISMSQSQSRRALDDYRRLINELESSGRLNRALEFIPADDVILERFKKDEFLTRPELSVLISYTKALLKEELSGSWLADNAYICEEIKTAFPQQLVEKFPTEVAEHRLRQEILATQVGNAMINRMGTAFPSRMQQVTGRSLADIAAAFVAARDIFDMETIWKDIEALDNQVSAALQQGMLTDLQRLVRRAANWLLNTHRAEFDPAELVARFRSGVEEVGATINELLTGEPLTTWNQRYDELQSQGVPAALAHKTASFDSLYSLLGIVATSEVTGEKLHDVASLYFELGERLQLHVVDRQIKAIEPKDHWESMARDGFREELNTQQRAITTNVLLQAERYREEAGDTLEQEEERAVDTWMERNSTLLARWEQLLSELTEVTQPDSSVFAVAMRELVELAHTA